jgi:multicomponent Na+:H+ antiporter subunit C
MIWAVALALGAVITAGTYLLLSRELLRCVIGVSMIGAGVNLLLFSAGRLASGVPPVIPAGASALTAAANPLPQALTLTAIVISFALLCFSLVLVVRLIQASGSDDVARLRAAEPPSADPHRPAIEERP